MNEGVSRGPNYDWKHEADHYRGECEGLRALLGRVEASAERLAEENTQLISALKKIEAFLEPTAIVPVINGREAAALATARSVLASLKTPPDLSLRPERWNVMKPIYIIQGTIDKTPRAWLELHDGCAASESEAIEALQELREHGHRFAGAWKITIEKVPTEQVGKWRPGDTT